jgi:hypothetical protein
MISLDTGTKGKFKASGIEFEIVDANWCATQTKIRFRYERKVIEIEYEDLRESAEEIEKFRGE